MLGWSKCMTVTVGSHYYVSALLPTVHDCTCQYTESDTRTCKYP